MARILITSGPTRQYLDPVRYLSNASSGRMGQALAAAAVEAGHQVVVVSGPVAVRYPREAEVTAVVSTEEMLEACLAVFPSCDGLIAVAAPCDYRPRDRGNGKNPQDGPAAGSRTGGNADIVARLAKIRRGQWMVAFALETEDRHFAGDEEAGAEELRPDRRQRPGGDQCRADAGRGLRGPAARCWPPWPAASRVARGILASWPSGLCGESNRSQGNTSPKRSRTTTADRHAATPRLRFGLVSKTERRIWVVAAAGDEEHVGGHVDLFAQAVGRAVGKQVVDDIRVARQRARRPAGSTAGHHHWRPSCTSRHCLPRGR